MILLYLKWKYHIKANNITSIITSIILKEIKSGIAKLAKVKIYKTILNKIIKVYAYLIRFFFLKSDSSTVLFIIGKPHF